MQATDDANVGPIALPLAAGSASDAITDPIVEGIADFLGWMLRHDLDDKLATLTGTSATAVPVANVFTFDPMHPRGHSVRRPVPALYVWWDGTVEPWRVSILRSGMKRTIHALYVFEEPPKRDAMELRRGLFATVNATLARAADQGGHPNYAYNGTPNGTLLRHAIGNLTWDWSYMGGQEGAVRRIGVDDPDTTATPRRERRSGQDFPAFMARFQTEELVQPNESGLKLLADSTIEMVTDGVTIASRVLEFDADTND